MPWRMKWEPSFAGRPLPTLITCEMSSGRRNRNWNMSLNRWAPVVTHWLPFSLPLPFLFKVVPPSLWACFVRHSLWGHGRPGRFLMVPTLEVGLLYICKTAPFSPKGVAVLIWCVLCLCPVFGAFTALRRVGAWGFRGAGINTWHNIIEEQAHSASAWAPKCQAGPLFAEVHWCSKQTVGQKQGNKTDVSDRDTCF